MPVVGAKLLRYLGGFPAGGHACRGIGAAPTDLGVAPEAPDARWFRDANSDCWACWCPGVVVTDKVDFQAEWFGRQMYQESQRTGIIDDLDKNEAYRISGHDLDGSQAN